MWDIEQERERIRTDFEANRREADELIERDYFLVSEYNRLVSKLLALDSE